MGKRYRHLGSEERELIAGMRHEGKGISEIALALGRDKATVSRELKRNASAKYGCYKPCRAHGRAQERRDSALRPYRLKNDTIRSFVTRKLAIGWSPELIAGRLPLEHPGESISHEAIYQYIYDPRTREREELIGYLVRGHRKRKKKGVGRRERKTKIPNRVPIDERPISADNRSRYGHWEGDSLVSRKSLAALNSMVERKSRLLLLTRLGRKSAEQTMDAVIRKLQELPERARRTLTLDNGTENARHEDITEAVGIKCYFADPYASWQRGANEQVNGMVRRYFPKGTDFGKITDEHVAWVEARINNRPRKCLGYKTPAEVAAVALAP